MFINDPSDSEIYNYKLEEEIFRKIVESAPNAIVLIDQPGKIILVNKQTEKLFGYERNELQGQSIEILIPKQFRKKHPNFRKDYFSNPTTRPMGAGRDLFGLHKNGTEIPVEIGLNPIESTAGIFILGSIIDITERKRAEEKFKRVVEATPSAIVLVNHTGKITLVNTQMEVLFGYSRNELIGQSIEVLIPMHLKDRNADGQNIFFTEPIKSITGRELIGRRKDGIEFPIEVGLNPIESDEGILLLGNIIDITERQRVESQKKEEAELAEQHSRELIRLAELEKFQKLTIGRELKMIELKKEINALKSKLAETGK